jgi:hypothetical protein
MAAGELRAVRAVTLLSRRPAWSQAPIEESGKPERIVRRRLRRGVSVTPLGGG